ncbi:MAG: glycosyltransferase family 2 protein [Planctomycetota bacterium]
MTGNERPLVSVIIPYYNGRRFVREAIQSALDQTHDNVEIVVVDDASPDKEDSDYIGKLADELGFKLIRHSTNKGIGHTLADAVEASTGDFIAELSQDDLYKPEKIERQLDELTNNDLDAVYAAGDVLDQDTGQFRNRNTAKTREIVESGKAAETLRLQNLPCISMQGLLAKRSVFEHDVIGIWREYLLDDWPVNIRLFERYRVGFIEGPLWTSRTHGQNTSVNICKWLGPQIEVVARMAPEHLKAEAVGNRISSMARRLLKQRGNNDQIIRLAFAGLMLTESRQQHTKATRVLDKIPSGRRKAIAASKADLLENILASPQQENTQQLSIDTDWEDLGKSIAGIVSAHEGDRKIHEIGGVFSSLAGTIAAKGGSCDQVIRLALAALMLMSDRHNEIMVADLMRSVGVEDRNELISRKKWILRVRSRPTLKSIFRAGPI